jgi:hypothetical protein
MKLPPNATTEEQERFASITGDVKTAALYREIEQLREDVYSCGYENPCYTKIDCGDNNA